MSPTPFMTSEQATQKLIGILRLAYSGELAAANAYRGHWRSVTNPVEKDEIFNIEIEELQHRQIVGDMLKQLKSTPSKWGEFKMNLIGLVIGLLCHFGGWFVPMYGAGKLESHNVKEYEDAARFALMAGFDDFVGELLYLAEVEWDHELYFRLKAQSHFLSKWFPMWTIPPDKPLIQTSFKKFKNDYKTNAFPGDQP